MNRIIVSADKALIGESLTPFADAAIVIEDGRITEVLSRRDAPKKYSGHEPLDLGKAVLMPGIIDSHSHTAVDAKVPGHLYMLNDPAAVQALRAVRYAWEDLASGVTTVRSLGDKDYVDVALRDAINADEIPGPRLLVAGIGMRGLHAPGFVSVPHTGVQEFLKTCRENMRRKVDWLKIFVTAGAPPVRGPHIPSFVSFEEIKTVTDEAKRAGLRTSAHCIGGEGLINCIKAGIDVIEHLYCATDFDLKSIQEHQRMICLTPSIFMDRERNAKNPPDVAKITDLGRDRVIASMRKIVASGVPYAIGSDALHGCMAQEAAYAVDLGASARDALLGLTVKAAALCGVDDRGSLEAGKLADIVAVEADPLENIGNLKNILCVMKGGIRYV
jgi:imidazolonepropionase-like amidohydrolase